MGFEIFNEIMEKHGDRMPFKDFTQESDIVLVVTEQVMFWGYIKKIGEENSKGLREVNLKLLAVPPVDLNLNMNETQLDGGENFSINEVRAVMKPIDFHREDMVLNDLNNKVGGDIDKPMLVTGNKTVN